MCGIWGFLSIDPHEENSLLFEEMCSNLIHRGTDATGVAVKDGNSYEIVKASVPSTIFMERFWEELKPKIEKTRVGIGHIRAATLGHESDNNNNHPIFGNRFILTHNGMVSTQKRIDEYKYKGAVDSEVILSYLETKEDMINALSATAGSAAISFVDTKDESDHIYLFSRSQTAYMGLDRNAGVFFWASEDDVLDDLDDKFLGCIGTFAISKIPENKLYKVTIKDGELIGKVIGEVPIKPIRETVNTNNNVGTRSIKTKRIGFNKREPYGWRYDKKIWFFYPQYDVNSMNADHPEQVWPKDKWEFDKEKFVFKNTSYLEQMKCLCLRGLKRG